MNDLAITTTKHIFSFFFNLGGYLTLTFKSEWYLNNKEIVPKGTRLPQMAFVLKNIEW